MDVGTFAGGAALGLAFAVPVGPVAVLCMRRALLAGPIAALAMGAGSALADALFALAAANGLRSVAAVALEHQLWPRLVASIVLCCFGITLVVRR